MTRQISSLLFSLVFTFSSLYGQKSLEDQLTKIFSDPLLKGANIAVSLRDDAGVEKVSINSNQLLIPASTLKLVTTLHALEILGPEYRFITQFSYSGDIAGGTLYGDIIIDPSGDPSFCSPRDPNSRKADEWFSSFAKSLKEIGIECITGKLIIHNNSFDKWAVHPSWPWDDIANYYAAGSFSFNFHENFFYLNLKQNLHEDQHTSIDTMYPFPMVSVDDHVTTGQKGSGDNAYFYGDPSSRYLSIEGTIPPGQGSFTIKGATPHPHEQFAAYLQHYLGWPQLESVVAESDNQKTNNSIFAHKSAALLDLVSYANEVSNNLYCDSFLKAISPMNKKKGFDAGVSVIKKNWMQKTPELYPLNQVDGSGLSMRNRITAAGMTNFLRQEEKTLNRTILKQIIPSLSKSSYFFTNDNRRYRCWLKSGSMEMVQSYAGLVEDKNGKIYYLSLMSNGHQCSNQLVRTKYELALKIILDSIDN